MVSENRNISLTRSRRRTRRCDQTRSGRLVILVQIVSWCSVGGLLILRGITTLSSEMDDYPPEVNSTNVVSEATRISRGDRDAKNSTTPEAAIVPGNNTTSPPKPLRLAMKINPSSAILITVGTTMLVIGPTLLLAKILDSRRTDRNSVKFSKVDPPPSYDDVVDKAPRYSSLFQVTESGELIQISGTNCTSVPV